VCNVLSSVEYVKRLKPENLHRVDNGIVDYVMYRTSYISIARVSVKYSCMLAVELLVQLELLHCPLFEIARTEFRYCIRIKTKMPFSCLRKCENSYILTNIRKI
jgi:hypothetical protein